MAEEPPSTTANNNPHSDLITSFTVITSSSIEEATFFLESHSFNLDSALSTFFETTAVPTTVHQNPMSLDSGVSPPAVIRMMLLVGTGGGGGVYNLRSRNTGTGTGSGRSGRIRTFADLNKKECEDCDSGSDDEDDKPQEYYTGGQRSGQLVQDPSKRNDVESLFEQARRAGAEDGTLDQHQPSSSSRSFSGRGRLLSGETPSAAPQQQTEPEVHTITFWTNGFTVNDGPLRRLDDPQNASFLESIRNSECPEELTPAKGRAPVHVSLVRKMEDYPIKKQRQAAFAGMGRTLGSTTSAEDTTATIPAPTFAPPTPFVGLVVDDTLPSTSIQLRLGDGTRMVSRFNLHHTVSNIRSFIDASRPGGPRAYQLLTMGFPPKQLNDLNQTIQEAGLANSVVIQKL
ncbi:plant UBX domain-containing protein 4-like protein [Tanacetum coccineum]